MHACATLETIPSGNPVPFQSSEHLRRPEPDGPTQLEGRDDPGNPPLVELAAADLEEGGEFGFREEFQFVARRGLVRVDVRGVRKNRLPAFMWNGLHGIELISRSSSKSPAGIITAQLGERFRHSGATSVLPMASFSLPIPNQQLQNLSNLHAQVTRLKRLIPRKSKHKKGSF